MKSVKWILSGILVTCLCFSAYPQPAASRAVAGAAADEYEVTIVFMGLMAFDLEQPNVAQVVLPDVTKGKDKIGDFEHDIPKHVAYLLASTSALNQNDPLNAGIKNEIAPAGDDINNISYVYLPLRGEAISIDDGNVIDDAARNPPLKYTTAGCNTCPDTTSATAMCWLSSMKKVHAGKYQKQDKKNYFTAVPPAGKVSARALLSRGTLQAHVIGLGGEAPQWEFYTSKGPNESDHKNDGTGHPQALAEEVHWKFLAKGAPFILKLASLTGGSLRSVAFTPTAGKVLIVVGNTTEDDIGPIKNRKFEPVDRHYSVYHLMKDVPLKDRGHGRIPHALTADSCKGSLFEPTLKGTAFAPASTRDGRGPRAPSGLNCSPTTWP